MTISELYDAYTGWSENPTGESTFRKDARSLYLQAELMADTRGENGERTYRVANEDEWKLKEKVTGKRRDRLETLLKIIRRGGPLGMRELYERYSREDPDPPTKRTVRNYLRELADLGCVEPRGENKDRVYAAPVGDDPAEEHSAASAD